MKNRLIKVLKVAAWAGGSAFAVTLVDQLSMFDWSSLGDKAPFAVAAVNVFAVAVVQIFGKSE